jgi:hypothetical protein
LFWRNFGKEAEMLFGDMLMPVLMLWTLIA